MALREFLLFNDLPKEVQQIDRVIYQFGKYYSEEHLNTGIDVDTCYILAYALIMLQTDRFNPNNKHKMTRWEFVDNLLSTLKETEGSVDTVNEMTGLIVREVLGYFYDNIVHSRFAKILPIQCGQALEALEDTTCTVAFPYPSSLALTSGGGTSSSSSIKSSSQVSLTSPLLRRGSFPWSPPSIDVYEYITQRKLNDLRLGTIFHCTNPFLGTNLDTSTSDDNISARRDSDSITVSDDIILPSLDYVKEQIDCSHDGIDYELLHKFVDAVNGSHCSVVLKVPKARGAFLDLPGVQHIAYQEQPLSESGKEYYLVRVIKLGMMSRQESKLRYAVKSWKRYFCLLTPVGMFFFKSLNFFRMVYLDKDQDRKTLILEKSSSGSTTSTLLESSEPSLTIFEGASATRTDKNVVLDRLANDPTSKNVSESPLRNFTFYIYTRNSRNVYMVDNQFELKSWINSINYLSAFATIELPIQKMKIFEPVTESIENDATAGDAFTEVTCAKTISIDSRLSRLCSSIESSSGTLVKYLQTVNHLELLTPLEPKTRDELISSSKILNVKLEWLWYELSRDNELYWLLKAMKEKEREGSGVGNVDGNEESQNEKTGHDGEQVQEEVVPEAEAVAGPDQNSQDESST
ncbi:DEKNAAC101146 [Brettanomyces naardenensis]|uniref:DEKNAAC101146 n=1 Tax=Brettanomyces naardenensis TaxID=13370 RepID=A0A448YH31_BRENA|nr:DEKNAAC101146 [Brettanomyces naardenensis]